ncbi:MAG TPA: DUF72 domain-containing protein [Nitrospira sp.]
MPRTYIGLSGYSYKPWQGPDRFYPPGLRQSDFLRHYAARYDTVELDGVWYRLPSEKAILDWIASTPDQFVFSPKVHRQITHRDRLKPDCYEFVQVMLDRLAPLAQNHRLGPLLVQLPPNLPRDDKRLAGFVEQLPKTYRWAIEFRHDSWHDPAVESFLKQHNVSWVAADTDDRPAECRDTADFWYVRLRRSVYDQSDLSEWAGRFKEAMKKGKDCFVYCKHEDEGSPWIWADFLLKQVTG